MNADNDKNREQAYRSREGRASPKRPWTTPTLHQLNASDAEVGTRAAADGAFTTS